MNKIKWYLPHVFAMPPLFIPTNPIYPTIFTNSSKPYLFYLAPSYDFGNFGNKWFGGTYWRNNAEFDKEQWIWRGLLSFGPVYEACGGPHQSESFLLLIWRGCLFLFCFKHWLNSNENLSINDSNTLNVCCVYIWNQVTLYCKKH